MSESPTASVEKLQTGTVARVGWVLLIVATLYVCYFSHLGAIGFVGPDEPRYAWIARAMAETGDWVTPRLYGQPWFEKPPLYYWEAAVSFKVFGVSEAAARLPSAISALLATLALAWLALRMYGGETARWLLLLLPTTVGMIGFSHAAATDMPFSGMLTMAMVCAAVVLRLVPSAEGGASPAPTNLSTPWTALVLFGFFLGLAVLAKGPAGIILCGGAVFFWALFTKRWRDAFRLLHPAAVAAFCFTALPWYVLCARRNPDFFRVFIIEHNFKRYLTPEFQHIQPFWYYGPVTALAIIPWIALLVPFAADARFLRKTDHPGELSKIFFLTFTGFTILFFSISKSKLPGYILPAVPPLMFVLADTCKHLREKTTIIKTWTAMIFALTILGLCLGLLKIAAWNLSKLDPNADSWGLHGRLPILLFLVGGSCSMVMAASKRPMAALRIGVVTSLLGLATFNSGLLSLKDLSVRRFAIPEGHSLPQYQPADVATYRLRRSYQFSLNFYFHHELPEWRTESNQARWVYTDFNNVREAEKQGLKCEIPRFVEVWAPVIVCEDPGLSTGQASSGKL
ncbi:MAG: glycosyltransferase family 39 protein [Candidatus Acidiferrum sp.]